MDKVMKTVANTRPISISDGTPGNLPANPSRVALLLTPPTGGSYTFNFTEADNGNDGGQSVNTTSAALLLTAAQIGTAIGGRITFGSADVSTLYVTEFLLAP